TANFNYSFLHAFSNVTSTNFTATATATATTAIGRSILIPMSYKVLDLQLWVEEFFS
ncbi:unnamed protein product, partial [Fusarium graminearum]